MLFNSYGFVLLFLPIAVLGYYVIGPARRRMALGWLVLVSLFFYAWWSPLNVLLMAPSVAINYAIVRALLRWGERRPALSRGAFWFGIAFNLCFLGYFKYSTFLVTLSNDMIGIHYSFVETILPLGISFITFQKIALLVDVRAERISKVNLRDYTLFVLFFPQLVAGPIVHYRELMPQFAAGDGRLRFENLAVGLTLFFTGLFKKVLLADPIAALIAGTWADAGTGGHPALFQAWAAALGYMLQLYFDFSGYSDMAIGAARLFGLRLPFNFNSPLKAASVIEYWSRWHVTLTRFLTAYIFSPLTLNLTRKRMARGLPTMGRHMTPGAFMTLLAYPTLVTMLLSGVWHGAGYQYLVFGAVHGVALVVNHAWRLWRPREWVAGRGAKLGSWTVTFLFVVAAEVFFRAPSVGTGLRVLGGMIGLQGVTLPFVVTSRLGALATSMHIRGVSEGGSDFLQLWAGIAVGLVIVLGLPNTLEMLAAQDPALGFKVAPAGDTRLLRWLKWSPSAGWALGLSAVTVLGLLSLGRVSDFLYWHF